MAGGSGAAAGRELAAVVAEGAAVLGDAGISAG
jgi:hypothetical protein